jgi:hypothetical protein
MRRLFGKKKETASTTFSTETTPRTSTVVPYETDGALGQTPRSRLPVSTNLYWKKSYKELMYAFGPSEDQPQLLSVLYTGWHRGRSRWVLYDGVDMKTSPKLATADKSGEKMQHTTITVLGTPDVTEQMMSHHAIHRETWLTFWFPVSGIGHQDRDAAQQQREQFEWRHSRGNDGRVPEDWGWKLLRLDSVQPEATRMFADAEELVAFWADNNRDRTNCIASLRFYNAGATGELGDEWSTMVAMTALRVFDITHDISFAAPIGASSGASVAAGAGGG